MKTKIATALLLSISLFILHSCRKQTNEEVLSKETTTETTKPEKTKTLSNELHLSLITNFLDYSHTVKMNTVANKTGDNTIDNRTLSTDSVDYYISAGLNYLYADASGDYSDFSEDSIITTSVEIIAEMKFDETLVVFNKFADLVKSKGKRLDQDWKIVSIIVLKDVTANGITIKGLKFNIGYKDPGFGKTLTSTMKKFATTTCYNWNYGTCTNPSATSTGAQIQKDFRSKVKTNYQEIEGITDISNKKVLLTDALNSTKVMEIHPHYYDTYNNPYGAASISDPTIKPTEIWSYSDYTQKGNGVVLSLDGATLNYYLDKATDIIYDFRFVYKPTTDNYDKEWAKLTNQTALNDFTLDPRADGACPIGRRYFLDCCYTQRHIYKVSYCNYVIVPR
jgi:hypothetical protein